MIRKQLVCFILRWLFSSIGMYFCIAAFGTLDNSGGWIFYVVAGLVFSLVNAIIKPIVRTFAMPLLIFTLGLFTIIVNVGMVALTFWIIDDVSMPLWGLVITAFVMSLANGLVNFLSPSYN